MSKNEDSRWIINCTTWTSQDEDMIMRQSNSIEFILICNLEKDLNSSSIDNFIYKHTTILPQAFVFARLLSDPFSRGAIMVDFQKKGQIIYEFLEIPNHSCVFKGKLPTRGSYRVLEVTREAREGHNATIIGKDFIFDGAMEITLI